MRWRIFARMRRFLRPTFRRPFPDFFVPTWSSIGKGSCNDIPPNAAPRRAGSVEYNRFYVAPARATTHGARQDSMTSGPFQPVVHHAQQPFHQQVHAHLLTEIRNVNGVIRMGLRPRQRVRVKPRRLTVARHQLRRRRWRWRQSARLAPQVVRRLNPPVAGRAGSSRKTPHRPR